MLAKSAAAVVIISGAAITLDMSEPNRQTHYAVAFQADSFATHIPALDYVA